VTSRIQIVVALLLALSVFAILVSPFAASDPSTLRSPQKLRPTSIAMPLALFAPLAAWANSPVQFAGQVEQRALHASDLLDLTCVRTC
jgi:hypothetical protein